MVGAGPPDGDEGEHDVTTTGGWRHAGRRTLATTALAAALATACTADPLPPQVAPTPSGASAVELPDPEEEALAEQMTSLRATVLALREELAAAADGDDTALERAGRLLAADLEAASDAAVARAAADQETLEEPPPPLPGGLAPMLPGPVVSRATTVSYGDLLTTTLAAARSAGDVGEPVARFLATPLAGDLGSWQRAPADLLALIAEAGTTADIELATTRILELDGDAPRALAWVVHGMTTPTTAEEAAGRAGAHLTVIETALEDLP